MYKIKLRQKFTVFLRNIIINKKNGNISISFQIPEMCFTLFEIGQVELDDDNKRTISWTCANQGTRYL